MFKRLLHGLLFFLCLTTVTQGGEVVLDLDKLITTELLPNSQYFHDLNDEFDAASINLLPPTKWTRFNRKQFRFGLTSNPIWVKTTLQTKGLKKRYVALDLHGVINNVQLQVQDADGLIKEFNFGRGSKSTEDHHHSVGNHISKKSDADHVDILLLPNHKYELLLKIDSTHAVIGNYRAVDIHTLDVENQIRTNGVIAFLFLVFLVTFYSCTIFITTSDKAFIFHSIYIISVMAYLLNSYGFLESWLGLNDKQILENALLVSLISTLLSLVTYFKLMTGEAYEHYPKIIKNLFQFFFSLGITTLFLMFVIPFSLSIRLLIVEISLAIILSPFLAFYHSKDSQNNDHLIDTRILLLRITLLSFTVIGGIHILNRLGLVDVYWFTDYILFLYIFIEAFGFAAALIININNDKKALFREAYFDRQSQLPNSKAFSSHFSSNAQGDGLTMIYFWVAGFDKLEVALGNSRYQLFLSTFAEKLSIQLKSYNLVIPSVEKGWSNSALFHTGKNNFAILSLRLNESDQQALHDEIVKILNHSEIQQNNIDFKVFIGLDNFSPTDANYATVTQNCLLALAQGIKTATSIKLYDETIRANKTFRRKLTKDFEYALSNDHFFLLWQPQYDVKTKKILGVEVFSRWQHPEYGLILPNTFVPILEKTNRICSLTQWVIKEVFEALPVLHKHLPEAEVSINISPHDLIDGELLTYLDTQLPLTESYASYIVLEVTESIMIDDFSVAFENIKELQLRGFKVSIENFGSGLASFSYLQTIPTNELKVDKAFSDRINEPKTFAILSNIIKLSQRLNIRLVVGGLETKKQVDLFTELGVERLQGWAISKPVPFAELLNPASHSMVNSADM